MFTYVTVIRDPLDRWLSNAYFELEQQAKLTDPELLTLMDRTSGYFADNLAVRAFAGKPTGRLTATVRTYCLIRYFKFIL